MTSTSVGAITIEPLLLGGLNATTNIQPGQQNKKTPKVKLRGLFEANYYCAGIGRISIGARLVSCAIMSLITGTTTFLR